MSAEPSSKPQFVESTAVPSLEIDKPNLSVVPAEIWSPMHGNFQKDLAGHRVEDFAQILEVEGLRVDSSKVDASLSIMANLYDQYQDPSPDKDLEGGHVFIGPSRLSSANFDYLRETYGTLPFLEDFSGEELNSSGIENIGTYIMRLVEIIPPRLMEKYKNIPGGIIYAPVTSQLFIDYGAENKGPAIRKSRDIIEDTVRFAQRRGADIVGLGAILPRLTRYGAEISERIGEGAPDITTGHGGTAWLAGRTTEAAYKLQQEKYDGQQGIGVLGVGAMGEVIADFIGSEIEDAPIILFDKRKEHLGRMATKLAKKYEQRVTAATKLQELFERSSVIVAALDESVNLETLKDIDLEGKIIIDDSQPPAFDKEQIRQRGAALLWVVGNSTDGRFTRSSSWNFFNSLLRSSDLFGCEAEAAAIATVDPSERSEYVINGHSATTADIRRIGGLFYGRVEPAVPQSFGELV